MELPPNTPPHRVWLANLGVLVVLGGVVAGYYFLTWKFIVGFLVGGVFMQFCHRAAYGRWIEWGLDGEEESGADRRP